MKVCIKVKFFEDDFVEAIGAGIYGIYLQKADKDTLLYVGESVFVLVRCAAHLYEIVQGKKYLGFTNVALERDDITLVFKLLDTEADTKERRKKEKQLVKEKKPVMQSGISDNVKEVEDMVGELTKLLEK